MLFDGMAAKKVSIWAVVQFEFQQEPTGLKLKLTDLYTLPFCMRFVPEVVMKPVPPPVGGGVGAGVGAGVELEELN
jgi:hypothetical protein